MSDYLDEIAPFTSDDWEKLRTIVLKNRIEPLGLNPAPIEAAAQFQASMSKLMEPISLPKNRTEADLQLWGQALLAGTQTESHCIGTRTDENGVEREVWQHTFTPEYWKRSTPIRSIDEMIGAYWLKVSARMRREERARKLKRRQRRAAQRRHNRGER